MRIIVAGRHVPVALLAVFVLGIFSRDLTSVADASDEASTPAQIQRWVEDLESDQFQDREAATSKLIAAGGAVAPIVKALKRNELEVTTRGIHVLQQLALHADVETADRAREALQKTAAQRVTAAARYAAEALDRLDIVRHQQALEELKRLGATVSQHSSQIPGIVPGLGSGQYVAIEIGEGWKGEPEDLKRLSWLQDVAEIILDGEQVNDQWLQNLPDTKNLTGLSIKRASITGDSLKHLKRLKGLEVLRLQYVPVGDGGVRHLRQLHNLTELWLYGVKLSSDRLAELRTSLPQSRVEFRGPALLGIGCHAGQIGCLVQTVAPASAAAKAGLQVNDAILKYEGKQVPDFETLTEMIAEHKPGDTISLEIQRGGQNLTKQVTLGAWD